MANNTIQFGIKYKVDKSGLTEVTKLLRQIQQEAEQLDSQGNLTRGFAEASEQAEHLRTILTESWDSKLGQLNLTTFNQRIKESYGSVSQLKTTLEAAGPSGAKAFNAVSSTVLSTNLQIKESNKLLDSMAQTMTNTLKWGAASSAMNSMVGAIQSAWSYTQKLDTSLNDIRIVTGKSAEEMEAFAQSANKAAQSLGSSTRDYTDASLIYYQQGLSDQEVEARTDVTLKTANVTGQSTSEVSEQLTAVWNGYNIATDKAEESIDILAAVAANTASDLEELSTGMSKVASAANAMGVGEEQLAAQLSTIISVTRQAPESVGTALKTIYARMSDIEAGVDEEGATLGSYTSEMAEMGINVLDTTGSLRDMGEVIEEIGEKWSDFSREQQVALAQTMAGTRQYNNLIALFDNWDDYTSTLEIASNATGTLQEQQDIYMDSIAAHLQQLDTAWESVYDTLIDTGAINSLIDALTKAVNILDDFFNSLDSGLGIFQTLGLTIANIFNKQIGNAVEKQIHNMQVAQNNARNLEATQKWANVGVSTATATGDTQSTKIYNDQISRTKTLLSLTKNLSQEEYNRLNDLNTEIVDLELLLKHHTDIVSQEDLQTKTAAQLKAEYKEINQGVQTYVQLIRSLEQLQNNNLLTEEEKNRLLEQANQYLQKGIITESEYQNIVSGINGDQNSVTQALNEQNTNLQTQVTLAEKARATLAARQRLDSGGTTDAEEIETRRDQLRQQFSDDTGEREAAQRISNITRAVSSLGIAISSVKSIITTLTDEDLSGWEKFSQIASNLVFSLPMLITSLPSLATALGASAAQASTLGGAMSFLGTAIASNIAIIAPLVGIAVAAGVAIYTFSQNCNTAAKSAERAAESAEELATINEQVTQSYSELQSAIDTYDSAKEQLDECVEGTEAWKEALKDTTEAAVDLLNIISSLNGIDLQSLINEYGELYDRSTGEFNQEILDIVQEQLDKTTTVSEYALAKGDYTKTTTTARSDLESDITSSVGKNGVFGFSAADIANTVAENVNSLSNLSVDELKTILPETLGLTGDDVQAFTQELDYFGEGEELWEELADSINSFTESVSNAEITLDAIAESTVADVLGDAYKDNEAVQQVAQNTLQVKESKLQQEKTDEYKEGSAWQGEDSDLYRQVVKVAEAAGMGLTAATGNVVKGRGDNREFLLTDAEGNTDYYDAATIASWAATQEAMAGVEESAKNAAAALDNLESKTESGAKGIEDYLTSGTFESMTQEEFKNLMAGINKGTDNSASSIEKDELDSWLEYALGLTSEEDIVSFFGDENYYDSFVAAAEDYETALNSYLDNLMYSTQEAFKDLEIDDQVSADAGKYIADTLQGAIIYGSQDTQNELQSIFSKAGENGELEELVDAFQDVDDWSNITTSTLAKNLKEAGVSTNYSVAELRTFIKAMQDTSAATQETTETLQETYASIHDIIDDLETGDKISSDNYETLLNEVGEEVSQYFSLMLEGTYKLTGDAEDFYELVQAQQIEQFTNQRDQLEDQLSNQLYVQQQIESGKEDSNSYYNYDNLSSPAGNDAEQATAQLNSLSAIGYDEEQLATWLDTLNSGNLDEVNAVLEQMANAIVENKDAILDIDSAIEETNAAIYTTELAIGESAESYEQLTQYLEDGTIHAQAFTKAYEDMWNAERTEDLDSDAVEDYANHLQEIADESKNLSNELTTNEEAAEDLAVQIMDMTDGVEDLADNWEDWSDILKNSSEESEEYSEAITGAKDAMSKLLDIDNDFISEKLILDNMADIEAAASGDAEAIDRLREAALEDIICNIALNNEDVSSAELSASVTDLQSQLDAMGPIEVGTTIDSLDDSDFINSCNAMIKSAGLTADEVTSLFSGMGYSVTYATEPQSVTTEIPEYTTYATPEVDTEITLADGTVVQGYKTTSWTEQTGSHIVEGQTEAFAMETSEPGTTVVPQIESITKKATGSYNNYSSSNSGGNSSGSSGSGSGSGSGSDSEKEPEVIDYIEDEIDLYHDVNLELKQIATNLSRLQKEEKKLTGKALLENLNEQLATLNDQAETTKEKLSIAKQEQASLKSSLSAEGVKFDEEGNITNYSKILQKHQNELNKYITWYNSLSAEDQEKYKDELEAKQEAYEQFKDNISDYDTLHTTTIPDLEDDIQDALDKQIEIQIQKFTMEAEIRLDMSKAERDWNKFYKDVILDLDDDDVVGNMANDVADIFSYLSTGATDLLDDVENATLEDWTAAMQSALDSGSTGSLQASTSLLQDQLAQLAQYNETGGASVYGDDYATLLEDIEESYTNVKDQLSAIDELTESVNDGYLDAIDDVIAAYKEQIELYEDVEDQLKHDIKLIELLYGDDAYKEMDNYYSQREANNNEMLAQLRDQLANAKLQYSIETDEEAKDKWLEEIQDIQSKLNSTVESSVQNIIDKYTNTISEIIDTLNDSITNGLGLDYVKEEWDLINDSADIYLDTINSLYATQSLKQKYLDAIDETDSISAQKKLNDLMEEQLAYLEEKENLTQYDVDRAEKLYEIALAEIALEEAQQNKSTMRLRRDSQGNYSYEYVSDEDAVAEAQQELLTLQNELYNFDKEQYQSNLDEMYSTYQEFQSKLLELYQDQTLSAEEREAKIALYTEYYGNIINSLAAENTTIRTNLMDSAMTELAALYETNVDQFKNMTDAEKDELMTSLVPQWNSSVQAMADKFAGENGGFLSVCSDAFEDLDDATTDYESSLDSLAESAGVDLGAVADGYDEAAEYAEGLVDVNKTIITQVEEALEKASELLKIVKALAAAWGVDIDEAKETATEAYGTIQESNSNDADAAKDEVDSMTEDDEEEDSNKITVPSKIKFVGYSSTRPGHYYKTKYATDDGTYAEDLVGKNYYVTEKASSKEFPDAKRRYLLSKDKKGKKDIGWVSVKQIELVDSLDTGGYTGSWDGSSQEGALALLHQKELVLNSSDTENILNAVNMVRDISSLLNNLNTSAFERIFNCISDFNNYEMQTYENPSDILEQDVHIEATFPNVTNSSEIEDAFTNLVNVASQYAYRNNR